MKFEFAIATDITEFAKKHFPEMYGEYEKVYICPDTWDYHLLKILKGYNEDYERDEKACMLEWNKIPKERGEGIGSLTKLKHILEEDDGNNWDCRQFETVEECIEEVDAGYGINS